MFVSSRDRCIQIKMVGSRITFRLIELVYRSQLLLRCLSFTCSSARSLSAREPMLGLYLISGTCRSLWIKAYIQLEFCFAGVFFFLVFSCCKPKSTSITQNPLLYCICKEEGVVIVKIISGRVMNRRLTLSRITPSTLKLITFRLHHNT